MFRLIVIQWLTNSTADVLVNKALGAGVMVSDVQVS